MSRRDRKPLAKSRRPADGRYAENPNRYQHYFQYQVILKPGPADPPGLYLASLAALGLSGMAMGLLLQTLLGWDFNFSGASVNVDPAESAFPLGRIGVYCEAAPLPFAKAADYSGIEVVRGLVEAGAQQLNAFPLVHTLLEHVDRGQLSYLAHEYMNAAWRPCFHADVVRDMAAAKLDWVASAELLENFTPLMLGEQARAVATRFEDPVMRELIKDMCASRCLRRDVFVRGARRLSPGERDAALGEVTLGLLRSEDRFTWEMDVPAGRAAIERGFFGPIVAALAEGPRQVRDLLALPDLLRRDNPGELVGVLVGTNQAMPLLAPPHEPDAAVRRFNSAAARCFVRSDNLNTGMALASSGSGAPLPCPMLDLFVAARLEQRERPDSAGWANLLGSIQSAAEQQRLADFIDRLIAERAPLWRQLGCLSAAALCV